LPELAVRDEGAFRELAEVARQALGRA
jgi:hypothetical protein